MKKETIAIISQYQFSKDERGKAVLHSTELLDGAAAFLAAGRTWKQCVQDAARRILESGIAGPDTFESRKEIARFIKDVVKAEYPGQIAPNSLSEFLNEAGFREKQPRGEGSRGGATGRTTAEKIAAYLASFDDKREVTLALKSLGYVKVK
jgi:hypothetical protein